MEGLPRVSSAGQQSHPNASSIPHARIAPEYRFRRPYAGLNREAGRIFPGRCCLPGMDPCRAQRILPSKANKVTKIVVQVHVM